VANILSFRPLIEALKYPQEISEATQVWESIFVVSWKYLKVVMGK
jgi:hypothetical protein